VAANSKAWSYPAGARRLGYASIAISVASILVSILIAVLLIIIFVVNDYTNAA